MGLLGPGSGARPKKQEDIKPRRRKQSKLQNVDSSSKDSSFDLFATSMQVPLQIRNKLGEGDRLCWCGRPPETV